VAVAYAAHRLGVPAKIFVPTVSAPAKIERIRQLGADLVVAGDRYADALAAAQQWAMDSGAMSVHAFDQYETLLGQGSVALELAEQAGELDTVLVPVGGGGLIAGMAAYLAGPVRVVGVEPDGAPTLTCARAHGKPADAPAGSIAADALAPRRIGNRAGDGVAAQVLTGLGADLDGAREQVIRLLDEYRREHGQGTGT
jgi:threonine dehydratase